MEFQSCSQKCDPGQAISLHLIASSVKWAHDCPAHGAIVWELNGDNLAGASHSVWGQRKCSLNVGHPASPQHPLIPA